MYVKWNQGCTASDNKNVPIHKRKWKLQPWIKMTIIHKGIMCLAWGLQRQLPSKCECSALHRSCNTNCHQLQRRKISNGKTLLQNQTKKILLRNQTEKPFYEINYKKSLHEIKRKKKSFYKIKRKRKKKKILLRNQTEKPLYEINHKNSFYVIKRKNPSTKSIIKNPYTK